MESQQYRLLVDGLLRELASKLGDEDPDELDASLGDGVLTIEFGDGAKFLVSRQSATQQVWVAAGARAWHYSYDPNEKRWADDKDGHGLLERLGEVISQKLGRPVAL
jgi:iron-sulfur cluster assembly protein CyaY